MQPWRNVRSLFMRLRQREGHRLRTPDHKVLLQSHNLFREISRRLRKVYKSPRLGNVRDPFSEIVYILLSTQTHEPNFKRTWRQIRQAYPGWASLAKSDTSSIAKTIKSGGLSNWKAKLLKDIAKKVIANFGSIRGLVNLRKSSDRQAEAYLVQLPGVKVKSARCVLLYSFDRAVFPVDTNVFRIVKRLGIIPVKSKERPQWVHDYIQEAIPEEERYHLHVNMIQLGRFVCRPQKPLCQQCCISARCEYFSKLKVKQIG